MHGADPVNTLAAAEQCCEGACLSGEACVSLPEALPAPPFSVQTPHPLTCKFLDGTNASPPLTTRPSAPQQVPRQGEEPVLLAWALLLPMAFPHPGASLPNSLPSHKAQRASLGPAWQLCCPAPLALNSRTCTSPRCTAGKQQDLQSAWTGPAGIGDLKGAMKQPLPARLPQLSSCRSLHLSPVSSFPPPPEPFVLLHSRPLTAWVFFSLNLFLSAFPPPFSPPK